jgi:hypothetical protein
MSRAGLPLDAQLEVIEDTVACYVVSTADAEDWLAIFQKDDGFPARAWATNMAATFSARLERQA